MNFHSTPLLAKVLVSEGEENKAANSSAADKKVEALSERTRHGKDRLPLKCLKANRKHSIVRSVTISRCTAWLMAHVNRQMYTLFSLPLLLTYSALVESTTVTSKGKDGCTRAFMSGGGSGALYS